MIVAIFIAVFLGLSLGVIITRLLCVPKCAGILHLCKHSDGHPIDMYTTLNESPEGMLNEKFVYFKVYVTTVNSQK